MSRRRNFRLIVASLLLAMPFVFAAHAHEVRPAYLEIKETVPGQFSLLWRTPVLAGMRLPVTLKLPDVSVSTSGDFAMMRWASVTKYTSNGLPLTVKSPLPGRKNTRATALLRRPVP